jgi:hypothetical protein
MQPIYSTNGEWVAQLHNGQMYNTRGECVAWLDGKDIYTRDGLYAGFLSDDGRVLRERIRRQRSLRAAPVAPTKVRPPATVPLAPLFAELPWNLVDVFEEEPEIFTYVSDLRPHLGLSAERARMANGWLYLLGLVLAVVGYFGPWVAHQAAALTVTGFELAEFAKFFPQVQGGTVAVARELFYFPFVAAVVLLAWLAGRSSTRTLRLIVPLLAAVLLLVALLPYSSVDALRQALTARVPFTPDPRYRGQLTLVVVGVVLTLLAPVARWLPRRAGGVLVALLAVGGVVPALWQFTRLHPLVHALYGRSFALGWGLIACVAGFVLLVISGILAAARPGRST